MNKWQFLLTSLVLLCGLMLTPSATRADWGCSNATWDLRGFGYSGSLYGLGYVPVPPYFAMHPPVYYGERYYRTYGESPFARPARSSRPWRVAVEMVTNPFVPALPEGSAAPPVPAPRETSDPVAAQPQMIINPYFEAQDAIARN